MDCEYGVIGGEVGCWSALCVGFFDSAIVFVVLLEVLHCFGLSSVFCADGVCGCSVVSLFWGVSAGMHVGLWWGMAVCCGELGCGG